MWEQSLLPDSDWGVHSSPLHGSSRALWPSRKHLCGFTSVTTNLKATLWVSSGDFSPLMDLSPSHSLFLSLWTDITKHNLHVSKGNIYHFWTTCSYPKTSLSGTGGRPISWSLTFSKWNTVSQRSVRWLVRHKNLRHGSTRNCSPLER